MSVAVVAGAVPASTVVAKDRHLYDDVLTPWSRRPFRGGGGEADTARLERGQRPPRRRRHRTTTGDVRQNRSAHGRPCACAAVAFRRVSDIEQSRCRRLHSSPLRRRLPRSNVHLCANSSCSSRDKHNDVGQWWSRRWRAWYERRPGEGSWSQSGCHRQHLFSHQRISQQHPRDRSPRKIGSRRHDAPTIFRLCSSTERRSRFLRCLDRSSRCRIRAQPKATTRVSSVEKHCRTTVYTRFYV